MSIEKHAVTTSVSVSVSGGEGHLSAEVDSRPYGLNGGRSAYYPGDSCYVLAYFSSNVEKVGSFGAGGCNFGPGGSGSVGVNTVREGVQFSNPVGSLSKPADSIQMKTNSFMACGNPLHYSGSTIVRLKQWTGSGSPDKMPPYGYLFVEYEPRTSIYAFTNLPTPPQVFSYPQHGLIFGVATPLLMT